jgi:hypothetical protein
MTTNRRPAADLEPSVLGLLGSRLDQRRPPGPHRPCHDNHAAGPGVGAVKKAIECGELVEPSD